MSGVTIDFQGAKELAQNLTDKQELRISRVKTLLEAVDMLEDEAKQRVPVKTGKLKKSIKGYVYKSGNKAYVRAVAKTAHLVELGTSAHVITAGKTPKRGKVKLALLLPGGIMRASAHHPGAKAQPFMHPALDENRERIDAILAKHGHDLMVRIARV